MSIKIKHITPVLPSSDIERDVQWYDDHLGFKFHTGQEKYAVLHRDDQWIHLQWHADTEKDPLLSGSVMKIFVDDIDPIFQEMVDRGSVSKDRIHRNTPWRTHEFGFYDLNKNAIFFVADVN